MFVRFFFHLRRRGLPVTVPEWLDLTAALASGLAQESMGGFYELCRCLLVKREAHLDLFDQCFAEHFKGAKAPPALTDELLSWLATAPPPRTLTPEEKALLEAMDLDEVRRRFEERLREQKERHDGGSHWVGTGGTSPFGHSGSHPSGIRVGGESRSRSAVQVAGERRFRALRGDQTLDTRQFGLALKRLRLLARHDGADELDVDASIAKTAKNLGDVELVWRPARKNTVRLLLLMDVGGSMTAHAELCERLFSAANSLHHFKDFRCYFFHNCVYDELTEASGQGREIPTLELLRQLDPSWHLLVVGDALMNPYELTAVGGRIDYDRHNAEPGLVWLQRLQDRFTSAAWLNPEPPIAWRMPSVQLVRRVFPAMFPLTLDGVTEAVSWLRRTAVRRG